MCLRKFKDLDMRSSWFNKLSIIIGPRPPVNWLFLWLMSLLVLIVVLGSSSSNIDDQAPDIPVSLIYTNYRRVKEQAVVDYLELRSVARGVSRQREFDLCG